jgi:UDP-glucose 4,6-dehydratase
MWQEMFASFFHLEADKVIQFVENRPFNDQRCFLDDEKLESLGWAERTPWEEGLRKTMEWYVANSSYWGDVSGALLHHPRTLMMPGYGALRRLKEFSANLIRFRLTLWLLQHQKVLRPSSS